MKGSTKFWIAMGIGAYIWGLMHSIPHFREYCPLLKTEKCLIEVAVITASSLLALIIVGFFAIEVVPRINKFLDKLL